MYKMNGNLAIKEEDEESSDEQKHAVNGRHDVKSPPPKRRNVIPLEAKKEIINECELAAKVGKHISFTRIATKWKIHPHSVKNIWRAKERILELAVSKSSSPITRPKNGEITPVKRPPRPSTPTKPPKPPNLQKVFQTPQTTPNHPKLRNLLKSPIQPKSPIESKSPIRSMSPNRPIPPIRLKLTNGLGTPIRSKSPIRLMSPSRQMSLNRPTSPMRLKSSNGPNTPIRAVSLIRPKSPIRQIPPNRPLSPSRLKSSNGSNLPTRSQSPICLKSPDLSKSSILPTRNGLITTNRLKLPSRPTSPIRLKSVNGSNSSIRSQSPICLKSPDPPKSSILLKAPPPSKLPIPTNTPTRATPIQATSPILAKTLISPNHTPIPPKPPSCPKTLRIFKKPIEPNNNFIVFAHDANCDLASLDVTPVEALERTLISWIDEQTTKGVPLTQAAVEKRAKLCLDLYERQLKAKSPLHFSLNNLQWYRKLYRRFGADSISKLQNKVVTSKDLSTLLYMLEFEKTTKNFKPQQIFTIDECGINWKYNENGDRERITLVTGANASGDCRLKPLLISSSKNPKALFHVNKLSLPVYYRANARTCLTVEMLTKWFKRLVIPQVRSFLISKKLDFPIILLVDSAPVHSILDQILPDKIKVIFMPPILSCRMAPMSQFISSSLQGFYLQRLHNLMKEFNPSEIDLNKRFQSFWKSFSIKQCIDIVDKVWREDVSHGMLVHSWKIIYPSNPTTYLNDCDFKPDITGQIGKCLLPLFEAITEDLVEFRQLIAEQFKVNFCVDKLDNGSPFFSNSFDDDDEDMIMMKPSLEEVYRSLDACILGPTPPSPPPLHDNELPLNGICSSPSSSSSSSSSSASSSSAYGSSTSPDAIPPLMNGINGTAKCSFSMNGCGPLVNGDISLPNGYYHQSSHQSSPAHLDEKQTSLEQIFGKERSILLMQVLQLPQEKIQMAQQLMFLLDDRNKVGKSANSNSFFTVQETSATAEMLSMLKSAYCKEYNKQKQGTVS